MPFKFGKLAGGFLALAALTAAGAPVKVPVPAENNGKVPGWTIRADGKTDVSGVAGGFRFHSPEKTVMVSASEKFPVADFTRVTIRANFKGTGTIQLGFHVYGRKGYICTFPGKKLKLDSPDQSVPLESVQLRAAVPGRTPQETANLFSDCSAYMRIPERKAKLRISPMRRGNISPTRKRRLLRRGNARTFRPCSIAWFRLTPFTPWKELR